MITKPTAIYVHIPFCPAKCHYCDFASYAGMRELYDPYVAAVCHEAARAAHDYPPPDTIYFGGGTPSLLSADQFEGIFAALPSPRPSAEVTVEANPATVTNQSLRALRALGVNRLSLGIQSFDDATLRCIGRQHTAAEAITSFDAARTAGFENLTIDLIFGLPDQDLTQWQETLRQAIELAPEHVSLYGLTIEDGTTFGRLHRRGRLSVPDEDAQATMYQLAEDLLGEAGYDHYEISNWAARRRGQPMHARHNLVYWHNEPYLGLGASAHSYFDGRRLANTPRVRPYIAAIEAGRSPEVSDDQIDCPLEIAETMMMGLRLAEGVTFQRFAERFGRSMRDVYDTPIGELDTLGLLVVSAVGVALSPRGRLLGNEVFGRFLSPALP